MRLFNRYLATICLAAFCTLAGLTWLTGLGLNSGTDTASNRSVAVLTDPTTP